MKTSKISKQNKRAFTMIELIFVIVILGVLAAVAIPKLNATRDDAEVAKALNNISVIMGDLASFYTAHWNLKTDFKAMTNVPLNEKNEFMVKNTACFSLEIIDSSKGEFNIILAKNPNKLCQKILQTQNALAILGGDLTKKKQINFILGQTRVNL